MNSKNEQSAKEQYKKLTETPVNKLIASLAVPTIISMMITMIYNLADTYFVSKINVQASAATGVVFSLMGIIQAFGFMYGQGAGSYISRLLGAKNTDLARIYCSSTFFYALATALIVMALGLTFLSPLMTMLGSTKTILPYSVCYGRYILLAAPAMITSFVMNNILRYEGMARLAMIALTTGGVLNMVLDPILIFGFKLGISGAGIATAVSQYIGMAILLSLFLMKKCQSRISIKYISLKPEYFWNVVSTGVPSFARQGLNSVSTMVLNIEAAAYGDPCIAAMSIVSKCFGVIFSVGIGIGQGFQPVASFNYGARLFSRVKQGVKFTWRLSTVVVSTLSLICFIFAPQVVAIFRSETEIVEIGRVALRFLCIAIVFLPTVMIGNMTFQSVGKRGRAFLLACMQNGLFFIPLVLVLPKLMGITGVEISQPVAYTITSIITVPMIASFLKHLPEDKKEG